MVCAGDATIGVMGTSVISMDSRLLDLSLFTALFAALGAISVGVVVMNPGALRGTGACMTGGGLVTALASTSTLVSYSGD